MVSRAAAAATMMIMIHNDDDGDYLCDSREFIWDHPGIGGPSKACYSTQSIFHPQHAGEGS